VIRAIQSVGDSPTRPSPPGRRAGRALAPPRASPVRASSLLTFGKTGALALTTFTYRYARDERGSHDCSWRRTNRARRRAWRGSKGGRGERIRTSGPLLPKRQPGSNAQPTRLIHSSMCCSGGVPETLDHPLHERRVLPISQGTFCPSKGSPPWPTDHKPMIPLYSRNWH
jgi:hypothetical protein